MLKTKKIVILETTRLTSNYWFVGKTITSWHSIYIILKEFLQFFDTVALIKLWNRKTTITNEKESVSRARTSDPLVKVNSTWSLTASTLLHPLVRLSFCYIYPMSGRHSTNWDRKSWPGLEIQMYYGCPCEDLRDT